MPATTVSFVLNVNGNRIDECQASVMPDRGDAFTYNGIRYRVSDIEWSVTGNNGLYIPTIYIVS